MVVEMHLSVLAGSHPEFTKGLSHFKKDELGSSYLVTVGSNCGS